LARNRIVAALRRWFEEQGFVFVDAAVLQVSPGNEAHLHAFRTELVGPDGVRTPRYLHTSPEFAMKKLLAAGEEKMFDFARVFRNRERSALHAPEFTMLEWYRAGAPYATVMDDCVAVLRLAAETAGVAELRFRGLACDPHAEPERLSVAEAFRRHAGVDILSTVDADGTTRRDALAAAATEAGVRVADDYGDLTDGSLQAPINVDEFGIAMQSAGAVWSAAEASGDLQSGSDGRRCGEWTSGTSPDQGFKGNPEAVDDTWARIIGTSFNCEIQPARLYCFEQ